MSKTSEILVRLVLRLISSAETPVFVTFQSQVDVRRRLSRITPLGMGPKWLFLRNVALAQGESNVFEASTGACL